MSKSRLTLNKVKTELLTSNLSPCKVLQCQWIVHHPPTCSIKNNIFFFYSHPLPSLLRPNPSVYLLLALPSIYSNLTRLIKLRVSFFQVSGARFCVGSTPLQCLLFLPSPCRTHICQPISKSSFSHLNNCLSRLTSLPTSNLSPKPLY